MTIPASCLRAFLQHSNRLKANTLLPVLSFVKFQDGTITKHTMREFMQYSCEFEGAFMVEERILNTFVNASKSDAITFSWDDKRVTIQDATSKISSPNCPIEDFPAIDLPSDFNEITEGACIAIGVCASMLSSDDDAVPNMKHVFTGGDWIAGTDFFIGAIFDTPPIPRMVLSVRPAAIVSRMKGCWYSQSKSYDLFQSGDVLYGSIKPEVLWFDMSVLRHKSAPGFDLDKQELLSFCDMAVAASGISDNVATIENGHELRMEFIEPQFSVDVRRAIQVAGPQMASFRFQPKLMQRLLRGLPAETVICSREEHRICFIGDGFTGMIQGVVSKVNN